MKVTSEQLRKAIDSLPDFEKWVEKRGYPEIKIPIPSYVERNKPIESTFKIKEIVFQIDIDIQGWVLKGFEV